MASGGTGSGPARPKNQWQDAPAWSMGARSEFTIVAPEAPSYPGPGAYNLTPDPQVRRPQQKKGFARDQKNTFAGFSPNLKDASHTPGPGAYVIPGDFGRKKPRAPFHIPRSVAPQHCTRVNTALAPTSTPSNPKQPAAMSTGPPSAAGITRDSPYGVVSRMGVFNSVEAMAWRFDAPPARKQGNPARYAMPTVASAARFTKAGPPNQQAQQP